MSHHFDTPTAQEDPRINLCDFYLFRGTPGTAAMALTVNPDAGARSPDTFREEGLYAFRFDLNGDSREEVTFKIRFGEVTHTADDEHRHVQSFEIRRSVGHADFRLDYKLATLPLQTHMKAPFLCGREPITSKGCQFPF
jgi:hypothetical protein